MTWQAGVAIDELQMEGSGLAFVAYPQALAQMPGAPFFSVLFFVMVICLGVDSQFAMVETVLTALNDMGILASLSKPRKSALICCLMGAIGLIFVTRVGLHWLELFDTFAVNMTLFACGALECVAIGWVYGLDKFDADVQSMTSRSLPRPVFVLVRWVIPVVLTLLSVFTLATSLSAGYHYPGLGIGAGWFLTCCAMGPLFYHAALHGASVIRAKRPLPKELSAQAGLEPQPGKVSDIIIA